jgi:CHASE2 domain-containing sensor protein
MRIKKAARRAVSFIWSIGTVLVVSGLVVGLSGGLLERPELAASDLLFRLRGPMPCESPIVVVAIDDASFAQNHLQWPWPRDYIARIVDGIAAGGPQSITLDVLFYEESDPAADAALAEAIANAGNVILINDISTQEQGGVEVQRLNRPLPMFEEAAAATGLANFPHDADNAVRRLLAFQEYQGVTYYSWALQTARLALGADLTAVSGDEALIGDRRAALDNQHLIVNYIGPAGSVPTYSAYQVAEGLVDPQVFTDRIVVVGATSESLHDNYATPFGSQPATAGVEINAQAINTILTGRYLHDVGAAARIGLIVLLALIGVVTARSLRALSGMAVAAGLIVIYALTSLILFTYLGTILPLVAPVLAMGLSYTAVTAMELYEERRRGARVRAILSQIQREKRRSDKLLHVIIPMGVAMTEAKDFNRLAEMVLLEAKALCNAEGASLYIRTDEDQLRFLVFNNDVLGLTMGGTSGQPISLAALPLRDEAGNPNTHHVAAHTALEGATTNIPDVYHAKGFDFTGTRAFDKEMGYRTISLLSIPLKDHENKVIGVMQIINARDPDRGQVISFDEGMQQLVESLSWMETIALGATLREEKLKQQIEELRIEIDEARREREVADITETEYFQKLKRRAGDIRARRREEGEGESKEGE